MNTVRRIQPWEAHPWILELHYAKVLPNIVHAYGLYTQQELNGIVTFGVPASQELCTGVCGPAYEREVLELNRLVIREGCPRNTASQLIAGALKALPAPSIVVSYADASVGHVGYVYQATNWLYTGLSAKRTMWRRIGGKGHNRTLTEGRTAAELYADPTMEHVPRPRKHRYVCFVGNKRQRKERLHALNYKPEPYPKGTSARYDASGVVLQQGQLF